MWILNALIVGNVFGIGLAIGFKFVEHITNKCIGEIASKQLVRVKELEQLSKEIDEQADKLNIHLYDLCLSRCRKIRANGGQSTGNTRA